MLSVCDLNKLLSCDHIYHINVMICHLNFYPLLLCNNVATVTSVRIRASHISGILGTQREKEYESATLVSFLAHMFLKGPLMRLHIGANMCKHFTVPPFSCARCPSAIWFALSLSLANVLVHIVYWYSCCQLQTKLNHAAPSTERLNQYTKHLNLRTWQPDLVHRLQGYRVLMLRLKVYVVCNNTLLIVCHAFIWK